MQVQIYDTTLRDGMQGEGMSVSAEEKLRVAHAGEQLLGGIEIIRGGAHEREPFGCIVLPRHTAGRKDSKKIRADASHSKP